MITRRAIGMFVVGVALLMTTSGTRSASGQSYKGKEFPDFTAKDPISGDDVSLSSLRGKVVIVDFWATWCGPCVHELPNVRRVYKKYEDDGLEVVSISLDTDEDRFRSFVKKNRMPWLHVMEGGGWGTRLAKKYGVKSIPAMYLVDHRGVCVGERLRGRQLEQAVKRAIDKLQASGGGSGEGRAAGGSSAPIVSTQRVTKLRARIGDASRSLAAATDPLMDLGRSLDRARRTIIDLKGQLPTPERPDAAKRRYLRLRTTLVAARKDLFVCGGLKSTVAVPVDVFAIAPTAQSGFIAAMPQLDLATKTIETMEQRLAMLATELDRVQRDLAAVDRRLSRSPGSPTMERAEELIGESTSLIENCGRSWTRQIRVASDMLDKLGSATGVGQLDALAAQVEKCRDAARDAAIDRNRSHDEAIRAGLDRVCAGLATLTKAAVVDGTLAATKIVLPSNPLANGSSADLRTRIEIGRQLDVASAALATLRDAGVVGGSDASSLAERLVAIEREVGSTKDDARLVVLQREFTVICEKMLALSDAAGK